MLRKLLLIIIIALIGFLGYTVTTQGIEVLGISIPSLYETQEKSSNLDASIAEAEELTSVTIKSTNDELNSALTALVEERQKYEDLKIQSGSEVLEGNINKTYEMEFIWAKIGNYAKDNNLELQLDVMTSSSGIANAKNLLFTINGSYVDISDFIYDVEDDKELGFKIEEFKIISDPTKSNLKSTFIVKDININVSNNIVSEQPETTTEETDTEEIDVVDETTP